ncbi:hypothetical protein PIROE2DRAFT_64784 [Piromyces sp. E2]|nr:hypothetical protein PIROE2DRAFT_64784 [Piromyces sp. E2]|eukprot:OUM57832.1 hypothetical protein PIROE2DRAFT_64784 [Piromyces sp. E2]
MKIGSFNTFLKLFLLIEVSVASIIKITNENKDIFFNQDGGSQEIVVEEGSNFNVQLESYQTEEYEWVIENINELNGIEPGEAVETPNESYIDSDVNLNTEPGYVKFYFDINSIEDLPTIKFVYRKKSDNEPVYTAEVILKSESSNDENTVYFDQEGGSQERIVEEGSSFNVQLGCNEFDEYEWTIENINELNGIEPGEVAAAPGSSYVDSDGNTIDEAGYVNFYFKVNSIEDLPTIKFVYRKKSDNEPVYTAEVILKSESSNDENTVYFNQEGGSQEKVVEEGSSFNVQLGCNEFDEYEWTIENINELNGIEPGEVAAAPVKNPLCYYPNTQYDCMGCVDYSYICRNVCNCMKGYIGIGYVNCEKDNTITETGTISDPDMLKENDENENNYDNNNDKNEDNVDNTSNTSSSYIKIYNFCNFINILIIFCVIIIFLK